jgi:peptidoglycan/xylan/chitin deacetylase (PgdA/CDA1 family)
VTRWTVSRLIKLGVSCLVCAFDFLNNAACRAFGFQRQGSCVVLYYHEVTARWRSAFAKQMDIMLGYCRPIRLDAPPTGRIEGRYVAVTFDDGFCSVVENALPELEKRSIPSTLFVVAGAMGKQRNWASRAGLDTSLNEQVLSARQLSELSSLITIGSHSLTHPFLPAVTESVARLEIAESRRILESVLNREIAFFSFPYGGFTSELLQWCAEAGYVRVFTTQPFCAFGDNSEFATGRVPVSPDDSELEFRLKILGAYRWLPYAVALKTRLRRSYRKQSNATVRH